MTRAALAALVATVVAVGGVAIVMVSRAGGDEQDKSFGHVTWDQPPRVFQVATLPRDRILTGRLRNDSLKEIVLKARGGDVKLVDAEGRPVEHTVLFADGYSRDIYPPRDGRVPPEADQERLGLRAKIKPGESRPITLSWRVRRAGRVPVRMEFPGGVLSLPKQRN